MTSNKNNPSLSTLVKALKFFTFLFSLLNLHLTPYAQERNVTTETTEEFINTLRSEGRLTIFDSPFVDIFENSCSTVTFPADRSHISVFCDVVVNSEVCREIPAEEKINCSEFDESVDFNALEFIKGCTTGLFDSVTEILNFVWDVLVWVWETIRSPGEAIEEGMEYMESAKLYLINEYDQAYEEASSPFRRIKAVQQVAGAVFDMLLGAVQDLLYQEYQQFGCMNFEARTHLMCQTLGEIIIPPAAALALIRGGAQAFRNSERLQAILNNRAVPDADVSPPGRGNLAQSALGRELTEAELEAVDRAHMVGAGQAGLDGTPAGLGNYTVPQLRQKVEILRAAGFDRDEVRRLMEDGIVGLDSDEMAQIFNLNPDFQRPPLSLEVNTGTPNTDAFREAFNRGEFVGTQGYISYAAGPQLRLPARIVERSGDDLIVELTDGTLVTLGPDQLATARLSPTAIDEFGALRTIDNQTYRVGDEVMFPRSSGGSSLGVIVGFDDAGRAIINFEDAGLQLQKNVDLSAIRRPLDASNPNRLTLTGRDNYDSFRESFNNQFFNDENRYVSYANENGNQIAARVVDADETRVLVQDALGNLIVLQGEQLNGIRASSTSRRLIQEQGTPEPPAGVSLRNPPDGTRLPQAPLAQHFSSDAQRASYLTQRLLSGDVDVATSRQLLTDRGLTPIRTVRSPEGSDVTFYSPFLDDDGRSFIVAEINHGGETAFQVMYRSNSQSIYRVLPAQHQEMNLPQYDKGNGEEFLTLSPFYQQELIALQRASADPPIIEPYSLEGIVPVNRSLEDIGAYRRASPYLIRTPGSDIQLDAPAQRPILDRDRRPYPEPSDIRISDPQMRPDYSSPVATYELNTPVYGDVQAYVYRSPNGQVEYTLMRNSENRIWFGDIANISQGNTTLGLRRSTVETDLTIPLWEYHEQIPGGRYSAERSADARFRGPYHPTNSSYGSAWNYIREIPEIRRWYEVNGVPMPD